MWATQIVHSTKRNVCMFTDIVLFALTAMCGFSSFYVLYTDLQQLLLILLAQIFSLLDIQLEESSISASLWFQPWWSCLRNTKFATEQNINPKFIQCEPQFGQYLSLRCFSERLIQTSVPCSDFCFGCTFHEMIGFYGSVLQGLQALGKQAIDFYMLGECIIHCAADSGLLVWSSSPSF